MLELAGLEMKENCQIEELTLGEKKILFLIKLVADTSKQYIFQSLFQDMKENEVQSAVRLIVEMSTYMNVILLSSSSEGYEICDRVIQWSGNDGRGHISRSKIKDMCIMPPFVMRDILKVIRATMCSADRENITTVKALLDEIENEALFNLLRSADKETLQIVFFRMLDIPTEQIAEKMGLTPNAIYLRINRLKEKIKKLKMGERK